VSNNKTNTSETYDLRTLRVPSASAQKFMPRKSLQYSETYSSGEWSGKIFKLDVSLSGLEKELAKVFLHCPANVQTLSPPKIN
jgi:hypothetical protein